MVHLHRLMRLIAALLAFVSHGAFAQSIQVVPAIDGKPYYCQGNGHEWVAHDSLEACIAFRNKEIPWDLVVPNAEMSARGFGTVFLGVPSWNRHFYLEHGGLWHVYNPVACPAGSTYMGGTQCKVSAPVGCPAGQHEEGGACVPDFCKPNEVRVNGLCVPEPECPAGTSRVNGQCKPESCPKGRSAGGYDLTSEGVQYLCEQWLADSCMVRVSPTTSVSWIDADGKSHTSYYGEGKFTGAKCTGGSPNPGGNNDGGGNNNNGGGNNGGGNTGGGNTGGGNTGGGDTGGNTGGGNTGGGSTGGGNTGGGNTGGGNTGGGNTGGGNTGGGSVAPTPNPNPPAVHPGTATGSDGSCPPGTSKINGRCYPNGMVPADGDGKCPPGFVRVPGGCAAVKPTGGGNTGGGNTGGGNTGGGDSGGSGNGSGNGNGNGNGDGDGDEGSGFGGSCMAGFACEGDAIQCAIAKEQHRRACRLFDEKSAESDLYDKEKGKEGAQTKDLPGNKSETMTGRINMSDAFGSGGQCIQDLSVTVMGQSMNLPFSKICPSIAVIGNIMVAVSLLLAARILIRG